MPPEGSVPVSPKAGKTSESLLVHVIAKVARSAASDLVVELKEDRFFDKPKGLAEISKALEEKGFIYPVTTLSGVVLGLVQKRLLGRKKLEGRWVYGK